MPSALATKLQIRGGQTVWVVNAPDKYLEMLQPLPEGAQLVMTGPADVVHLFARDSGELARHAPAVFAGLKPGGMLWASYPKGGSGIQTDLNRDTGWSIITNAGWEGVRQIAIDKVWSAVRFKVAEKRSEEDAIERHFVGDRAAMRPIYERIAAAAQELGSDVEVGVRDAYIALRRNKQFAVVKTGVKPVRLELGLRLPGHVLTGRLVEAGRNFGAESATHKVVLDTMDAVDDEVTMWLAEAYRAA